MVVRNRTWIAAVLAGAGALGWWLTRPCDERYLKSQLVRLARTLEKSGPESVFETAQRATAVANAMAEDVIVESGRPELGTVHGRADVRQAVAQVRASVHELQIDLFDVNTKLEPGRTTAVQRCTVRAVGRLHDRSERGTTEVEVRWIRQSVGWRIGYVKMVEVVRPLPDA